MLEVRGSNPGHSASKIPLLYPETLEVPIRGRVQLRILELGEEAGEKQKKKKLFPNFIDSSES